MVGRLVMHLMCAVTMTAALSAQVIHTYWNTSYVPQTSNSWLYGVNAGDVDGDGADDVWFNSAGLGPAFTLYSVARQMVLFTGPQGFPYTYSYPCGSVSRRSTIAAGRDIDGDGWPDYAYSCNSTVHVRSGRTHNTIWTITTNGSGGTRVALLDGNGDGYCDILAGVPYGQSANNTAGYVRLYSGRTGAQIWENSFSTGLGSVVHRLGDIDGDGCEDLVSGRVGMSSECGSAIYAISGRTGALVWLVFDPVNFPDPLCPTGSAGDINGDGRDDVIVNSPNDSTFAFQAGRRRILSGLDGAVLRDYFGNLQFGYYGTVTKGDDWDLDGIPDQVVGTARLVNDPNRGLIEFASGATGGVFQSYIQGYQEVGFVSSGGDFNGDGTLDVLISAMARPSACGYCGAVDVYQVRTGPAGHARPQGHGCPGSDLRLPTTTIEGYPRLGTILSIDLHAAVPMQPAFLVVGNAGGTDLGSLGAPGCRLNTLAFWWELLSTDGTGRARKGFTVPPDPALAGLRLDTTWAIVDPPANALGVVTATGLAITLGS